MREIYNAEGYRPRAGGDQGVRVDYGAKYPKAVAKIVDDAGCAAGFYKYPASTGSICALPTGIESAFATVRLRTKVTRGRVHASPEWPAAFSRSTPRKARWRAVNAPAPGRSVRAGAIFHQRQTARATHRHHPVGGPAPTESTGTGGRLRNKPDPQVLTILLATENAVGLHLPARLRQSELAESPGVRSVMGQGPLDQQRPRVKLTSSPQYRHPANLSEASRISAHSRSRSNRPTIRATFRHSPP